MVKEIAPHSAERKMFWRDKRVLVTGAAGFLGSWMCRTLLDLKAVPVCLIRDWDANSFLKLSGASEKVIMVHGELENLPLLERVFSEFEIDTCFHLGAQALVGVANANPFSTFESNIRGTWNILEAARRNPQVQRIAVASSDKAYGHKDRMPYTEEDRLEGYNPYDFSKTCADTITQMYAQTYNVPAAVSRCGNLYGPGDLNWSRIVPGTFRSFIYNEAPIIRSDGTYLRDYLFVGDAVDAYLTLAENLPKIKGQAFNFGTEKPTSVLDLVDMMREISGKKNIKPKIMATAKGEIKDQYLSSAKANKQLKWHARTSLNDALTISYRWYLDFLK